MNDGSNTFFKRKTVTRMKHKPNKLFTRVRGIRVAHEKTTAACESVRLPIPSTVAIPMQMHIGAPCAPTVKVGDTVLVGQKIGDSEQFVSAPIHASVSGTVKEIKEIPLAGGAFATAVIIASDGQMTPAPLAPPKVENAADLARAVRECGLVGLGGAGFPTHVKLRIPEGKKIDTLLINAAECEPYLTADNREILENTWDVMSGIYAVKRLLNIPRVAIGVEANKPEAIAALKKIAESSADENDEVDVLTLPTSYPQGAEKILIKSVTGREVPPGKLPSDVGCIVMNVTSIAVLSRYLKTGMPLTEKRITVDGTGVLKPQNIIAPIGTSVEDILSFVGCTEDVSKILLGGPMMGNAIADPCVPVVRNTNGIVVMGKKEAALRESSACIRCGRCVLSCPMRLSPVSLEKASMREDKEALSKLDVMNCMECGACAFVCPASRPLVQSIRFGKGVLRSAKK